MVIAWGITFRVIALVPYELVSPGADATAGAGATAGGIRLGGYAAGSDAHGCNGERSERDNRLSGDEFHVIPFPLSRQ